MRDTLHCSSSRFSLAVGFGSEVVSESVAFWREIRKEVDTSVSHARLMTSEFKDGMLSFEACVSFKKLHMI